MTSSAGVPADARAEYRRVDMAEIHEAGRPDAMVVCLPDIPERLE